MKRTTRYRQIIFFCLLTLINSVSARQNNAIVDREVAPGSNDDIKHRLKNMSDVIEIKYTEKVQDQIEFLLKSKNLSRTLLGRAEMYFPLMDNILLKHNVPTDLKYLAVIESGLVPYLSSGAGASGLWQFMPGTAQMYGLKVKDTYDERKDAIKSTEAAALYLKKLYKIYGDWTLVLAAYNCGDGTLNRAMKKTSSKSYWDISSHLPQQTQDFVPRYIAAAYLMNFYYLHELEPDPLPEDYVYTGTLKVYQRVDLLKIAEEYQISPEAIKRLNAVYTKGFIPESQEGEYFLTLPESKIYDYATNHNLLSDIAGFSIPSEARQKKNSETKTEEIAVAVVNREPETPFSKLPNPAMPITNLSNSVKAIRIEEEGIIKIVRLEKGQSLKDIAEANGIELAEIIELNRYSNSNLPKLGDQVKVRI